MTSHYLGNESGALRRNEYTIARCCDFRVGRPAACRIESNAQLGAALDTKAARELSRAACAMNCRDCGGRVRFRSSIVRRITTLSDRLICVF
jgi:hypothetical protein